VDIALIVAPPVLVVQQDGAFRNNTVIGILNTIPLGLGAYAQKNVWIGIVALVLGVSAVLAYRHRLLPNDSRIQRRERFFVLFFTMLFLEAVLVAFSMPAGGLH
jgi:hypothetical protein